MKTKITSLLFILILLFSGCGTKTVNTEDAAILPPEDDAKEITVEVIDYRHFYREAAKKFEEKTGVKVNVIDHYDQDFGTIKTKIEAELMAGKGADIYGMINLYPLYPNVLGSQNLLCDMAGWIAQDPDFNEDAYYMGILESTKSEGKMYGITLNYAVSILTSSAAIPELEGQKNLTWEQFFDKTKDVKRTGALIVMSDMDIFHRRFLERKSDFVNEKNKTQKLDSPEMIKLLEQCKEWGEQGFCWKTNSMENNALITYVTHGAKDGLLPLVSLGSSLPVNDKYYYAYPSDCEGKNAGCHISSFYVNINAASKAKGTAWKFVKFLLSEEMQSYFLEFDDFAVNRNVMEKEIEQRLTNTEQSEGIADFGISLDEAKKYLNEVFDSMNLVEGSYPAYDEIIRMEAIPFFLEAITAEEAAENMANKVELYLKEQRY